MAGTNRVAGLVGAVLGLVGAVLGGVVAGGLALTGPAAAHSGVTVEPKVAGSPNALVTFNAQAESGTAGIGSVKVVLPDGLAPSDVTYAGGPTGWTLAVDTDGFSVGGTPTLPTGRDARFQVRLRQLPLVPTLVFKVLVNYTNGQVDRWIEVPRPGAAEPANPAPVVTLAAPPGGFPAVQPTPSAVSSAPPAASASAVPPAVAQPPVEPTSGSSALPWVIGVLGLVVVLGGLAALLLRGRRPTPV